MAIEDLISVSVAAAGGMHFLRFHIRDSHLKQLDDPERLEIRGQAANGFIIAPSRTGLKLNKAGLASGGYLQTTLNHFELSKTLRKRIDVRPAIENGQIKIPPMPQAWIEATAEFVGAAAETPKLAVVARDSPPSPPTFNGSVTSPLPKSSPVYEVPSGAGMTEMQAQLASRLNEAKAIIKAMEDRTGMKFVLDRNLRLVVAL
jgi:hypothetical protein